MNPPRTDDALDLLALCESIKANADELSATIIRRWKTIGEAEPWHLLPSQLDFDHLPELIRALAGAALCTDFDRELCARVVHLSAQHGEHRAGEGLEDTLIYREYHLLRRALWRLMKDEHGESAATYYATMRIDALVSLANAAALHGLNRSRLEEQERWPSALDDLLEDWPLPGPRGPVD